MHDGWLIFSNLALPICAGITFFALARYVLLIAPMRTLVTGELTYKGASWGFAFFGLYLITRPLQILLGPHPMPLIVNSVREYCMMGLFAPAVFVAMMSLCFGADRIPKRLDRRHLRSLESVRAGVPVREYRRRSAARNR